MAEKKRRGAAPEMGHLLGRACRVGESKNYNFQGTEYTFWPFSTIEQIGQESRYKARAIVAVASGDSVVFNSYHQEYRDAERAIEVVRESLTGDGPLYNIFAETIDVHTAEIGPGKVVTVCETLALIWSFNYPS
ncbi:MAG: hypothetical protein ACRDJ4_02895 [Actinomycetota bacterium]